MRNEAGQGRRLSLLREGEPGGFPNRRASYSLIFLSLLFGGEKAKKNTQKSKDLFSSELQNPWERREKRKEFLATKKARKSKKARKGRSGFFFPESTNLIFFSLFFAQARKKHPKKARIFLSSERKKFWGKREERSKNKEIPCSQKNKEIEKKARKGRSGSNRANPRKNRGISRKTGKVPKGQKGQIRTDKSRSWDPLISQTKNPDSSNLSFLDREKNPLKETQTMV